jgi:CheY-like chemotaxis protein
VVILESGEAPRAVDRHWSGVDRALSPAQVLVVEDDPTTRDVALLMLDRLGYQADAVGDGLEALAAARAQPYDVILMDLQLPEMGGMEATRRIRSELPASLQPTVIAVTAGATTELQTLCRQNGMDECLTKPIRIRQLAVVLETWGFRSDRAAQFVPFGQPVRSVADIGTWAPQPIAPTLAITPVAGPSVYDPTPLDALVADLGPERGPIRWELIETFLEGADDWVVAIGEAVHDDDGKALAFVAHSMKSASASLGLLELSEAADRIESAFRDGPDEMDVALEAVALIARHNRATVALRVVLDQRWQGALSTTPLGT